MIRASRQKAAGPLSKGKRVAFWIVMFFGIMVVVLGAAEVAVRLFNPQPYMYPRWKPSPRYGSIFPPNYRVEHGCPGRWRFIYTTNRFGHRGEAIPLDYGDGKQTIVVLGDSFSFGMGVGDGEEYPAVLAERLADQYYVVNLSLAGWGLTQQIRMFYDFGQFYHPTVVILQFCANDLLDNLQHEVTTLEDGKFVFRDGYVARSWLKEFLSRSALFQKSQLYCLVRSIRNRKFWDKRDRRREQLSREYEVPPHEKLYVDLLEAFADDLHRQGVVLLMTGPEDAIAWFPYLQSRVKDLESRGILRYLESSPWFDGVSDYGSPEGHSWGKKGHRIVGEKLAEIIMGLEMTELTPGGTAVPFNPGNDYIGGDQAVFNPSSRHLSNAVRE